MTNDENSPQTRITDEYESPVSGYQLLLRVQMDNSPGKLGSVATAIGQNGGDIGPIDIHEAQHDRIIRDMRVFCRDAAHARELVGHVELLKGVEVIRASDRTFQLHRGGKIEIANKVNPLPTIVPLKLFGSLDDPQWSIK